MVKVTVEGGGCQYVQEDWETGYELTPKGFELLDDANSQVTPTETKTGPTLRRRNPDAPPQFDGLRAYIRESSVGTVDSDRLDLCWPLLNWLERQRHGQAPITELPDDLRDPDMLRAADLDGLIEFGRRNAVRNENTNRHELLPGWPFESVSRDLSGSSALLWGGKSMSEILAEFKAHDARCEHPDIRWHVRPTRHVYTALVKWRLSSEANEARQNAAPVGESGHQKGKPGKSGKAKADDGRRLKKKARQELVLSYCREHRWDGKLPELQAVLKRDKGLALSTPTLSRYLKGTEFATGNPHRTLPRRGEREAAVMPTKADDLSGCDAWTMRDD